MSKEIIIELIKGITAIIIAFVGIFVVTNKIKNKNKNNNSNNINNSSNVINSNNNYGNQNNIGKK